MKLLKKLDRRPVGSQLSRWGLFYCPVCNKNVEKRYHHGLIQLHCGCTGHGGTKSDLYKVWCGIKRRCYNNHEEKYYRYGERGIKVCDDWRNSFKSFKVWADENNYIKGYHIDRKDNDGDYCPENCRFLSPEESARNKSNLVLNIAKARKIRKVYSSDAYNYADIGRIFKIDPSLVRQTVLGYIWKEIT